MNKKELVYAVSELQGGLYPKTDIKEILDSAFQAMENALIEGRKVSISKFGTLLIVERQARKGRNPQTEEEIQIPAHSSVKFKPAKALKAAVVDVKPSKSGSDSDESDE